MTETLFLTQCAPSASLRVLNRVYCNFPPRALTFSSFSCVNVSLRAWAPHMNVCRCIYIPHSISFFLLCFLIVSPLCFRNQISYALLQPPPPLSHFGPVWFEGRGEKGKGGETLPLFGLKNWRGGGLKYSLPFPSNSLFWIPPNWGDLEGSQNFWLNCPTLFYYISTHVYVRKTIKLPHIPPSHNNKKKLLPPPM